MSETHAGEQRRREGGYGRTEGEDYHGRIAGPLTERGNKHKEYERDYPDDGRNYRAPAKAQLIDDWPDNKLGHYADAAVYSKNRRVVDAVFNEVGGYLRRNAGGYNAAAHKAKRVEPKSAGFDGLAPAEPGPAGGGGALSRAFRGASLPVGFKPHVLGRLAHQKQHEQRGSEHYGRGHAETGAPAHILNDARRQPGEEHAAKAGAGENNARHQRLLVYKPARDDVVDRHVSHGRERKVRDEEGYIKLPEAGDVALSQHGKRSRSAADKHPKPGVALGDEAGHKKAESHACHCRGNV